MAVALLRGNTVVSRMTTTGRIGSLTQGPTGRYQATVSTIATSNNTTAHQQNKILFANIRGLHSNINSVHHILQTETPNLLFLTECQVSPLSDPSIYNFPGYNLLPCFRLKGGVCCYVKSTISLENIFNFASTNFDYSIFKQNLSGNVKYFCCVYRSPNCSPTTVYLTL